MELRLEIVSFQKTLMGDGQARVFDETGGSIGRGRDNSWVLPDPNRYVSTRHAEIDCVDGRFRITDVSTNGVFVNGSAAALGRDGRAVLSDGDRLVMGDYEIAARLQERAALPPRAGVPPSPLQAAAGGFSQGSAQDAPDILDVVGRRRAEPRLGPLEIPEDPAAFRPRPAERRPIEPPLRAGPLPPPPPRPAARAAPPQPPAGAAQAIPDDVDLVAPSPAAPPVLAPLAVAERVVPPAAPRHLLPDDLDDLLPDGPEQRPAAAVPPVAPPRPPLPDDLDDLLRSPAAWPDDLLPGGGLPVAAPPGGVLPDGVPLVRPVPGTGNRPEPLSPAPALAPSEPDRRDVAGPAPSAAVSDPAASWTDGAVAAALAEGLGLDARSLGGLDPRATTVTVARAARAAALGIAGAIDARNALARAAGIDARELGRDDENPFLTYRSGEAALRHCLTGVVPGGTLDSATRESVTALTVTAAAAAAALDAVLDRLASDGPPGSAEQVREIFGAAFLNAYHREMKRST